MTIPLLVWAQRIGLLAVALLAPWNTVAAHSSPVNAVIITIGWFSWTCAAVSSLVVVPIGLTALRVATPLLATISLAAVCHESSGGNDAAALMCSLVVMSCTFTTPVAAAMVQGSAYGNERRFPLRTPVPYIAPACVSWALLVSATTVGPLLLAARAWVIGAVVSALGVVLVVKVPSRLHRLARRWLVIVPAGIVLHDHVVLAETVMIRTHEVEMVTSVDTAGEEADLTGGTLGRRIRFDLRDAAKIALSPITARTLGTTEGLHVKSFAISPRPHAAAFDALTTRTV